MRRSDTGNRLGIAADLRPGRPSRHGMTLIEMTMSLLVSSILMVALGSSVMIASRAVPTSSTPIDTASATAEGLDRLMSEVAFAKSVTELTTTAVTFTVAPRGTDTTDETIRYAWDGVSGHPLTRQYNGGTAATVVANVRSLNLAHVTTSIVVGSANVESSEQVLCGYITTPTTPTAQRINSTNFAGEYFVPTLPTGAVSWKITRVQFQAQVHGPAAGQTYIQIRTGTASGPTSTIVDQGSLSESSLTSSFTWQQVNFSAASGLSPTVGMCLVFQWVSDADSCDVQYDAKNGIAPTGSAYLRSSNGGSTWTTSSLALCFNVYGTYTSPTNVLQYNLQTVRASISAGSSSAPTVTNSTEVLNHPQVTGP